MKWIVRAALLVTVAAVCYLGYVAAQIQKESVVDEAVNEEHTADAIVVLGAAEYRGRPSPVLEARLNHALFLYLKGRSPRIITTGGAGGGPVFTEGMVGRGDLAQGGGRG